MPPDELNNRGFFEEVARDRAIDGINNGPPEFASMWYRNTRRGWLEQLANLHRGLNEGKRKNLLMRFWMNKNRIKYLQHDIQELQGKLANLRHHYYNPQNRLVRATKGYL